VHPGYAEAREETRIKIDLGSAGSLAGHTKRETLELRTPHAATRVQAEHISIVRVSPDDGRMTLVLANGDKLESVRLVSPLALRTAFGDIVLDGTSSQETTPSPSPVSVAVKLADGVHLAGQPKETNLKWLDTGAPVSLAQIRELRPSGKAGEMLASTWSGATTGRVSVAASLGLTTPFGELQLPYAQVVRARVSIRASKQSPAAGLGNVALSSAGAVAESATGAQYLNDGRYSSYSTGRRYAYGEIPCSFTVTLPDLTYLTTIRFLLWDRDRRSFSYVLETSEDGVAWTAVADCSSGLRRSWEQHTFAPRPARHVRVRGLGCTATKYFHIEEIEAYSHPPRKRVLERWSSGVPDAEAERLVTSSRWRKK
jgi:hypothetical protein